MSFLDDAFADIGDIGEHGLVDIRLISGSFIGSANQFITLFKESVVRFVSLGIDEMLLEYLPTVAKKTGELREQLIAMFINQIQIVTGDKGFRIFFDQSKVTIPEYLRYHDVEWELNPKFNIQGYKSPTTPGTKPFSENEMFKLLYQTLVQSMLERFIERGFNFTIKSKGITL